MSDLNYWRIMGNGNDVGQDAGSLYFSSVGVHRFNVNAFSTKSVLYVFKCLFFPEAISLVELMEVQHISIYQEGRDEQIDAIIHKHPA